MTKITSVERSLIMLEVLSNYPEGIGLTELGYKLELAKSTTHRLLKTLKENGYVIQDYKTNDYLLGTKVIELAGSILDNLNVKNVAKRYLEDLCAIINEVVHLCIHENGEAIYIDKFESDQTIRMHSRIGKRAMMHSTGVGKVLLSGMNQNQVDKIIKAKGLPSMTPNTITNLNDLYERLEKIRVQRYEIDNLENEEGIRCIAGPIYDHEGKVVASFSISGPENRMTTEYIENNLVDLVAETTKKISKEMGYNC